MRVLLLAALLLSAGRSSLPAQAGSSQAPANQFILPFLFAPYPGTASEEAVFDHSSPNYSQADNRIVAFTGDQGDKLCPSPEPGGSPPPQAGVCDGGSGLYWSYSLGDWLSYNGHDGIDYGMQYRPVYAAADASQVLSAGWTDPMDHRYSLGLAVRLQHPNGYTTTYGHLSALAVQACSGADCPGIDHGAQIGYSGNTGNSAGPHLHFRVGSPDGKPVDPYGWTGEFADPWPYNQPNSLWVELPSVVPYYGSLYSVLPSGAPLPLPAPASNPLLVDDSAAGFSASPSGCWTSASTGSGQAVNGSMRYVRPVLGVPPTCSARWTFPTGQPAGSYAVYVHLPGLHSTSEGARYSIAHAGRVDQVVINQASFPNPFYTADGWLFIGSYDFSAAGSQFVSLDNLTQDTAGNYLSRELGVDAVRFARQLSPTPSMTPSPTATASRTPSATATQTASATPSMTSSPSATPSVTPSATPSVTPSQTQTPTASATPSQTRSRTPSITFTRTVTASPTASQTLTRTPSITFTRTATVSPKASLTRSATPGRTLTRTPSPTRTSGPSATRSSTATPAPSLTPQPSRSPSPTATVWSGTTSLQVYFTNRINLGLGRHPFETQVTRRVVGAPASLPDAVLVQYFLGPTGIERFLGLDAILSGFTGYSRLRIENSVAHVYLVGNCNTGGESYTISQPLRINLLQFPEIKWVKIYDQYGRTQYPAGQIDSIPTCLEP